MLVILTTHPIQYQIPLWQALARDGRVQFEVWYLTDHGVQVSLDKEFGKAFAWDIDMLADYPYRFLKTAQGATPGSFWKCRLVEPLANLLRESGAKVLWIQGWQVAAYWQAVWAAEQAGVEVWLRGESNDLTSVPLWKHSLKRLLLGQLFKRVDHFLCIGQANRRLYEKFGMSRSKLHLAPYAVDNERLAHQAELVRPCRAELRRQWGIAEDAFCVLYCGKFISVKRPLDVVAAARLLNELGQVSKPHLLFVGSGELGEQLRSECSIVFDADNGGLLQSAKADSRLCPSASFAGFLNQMEISQAYIAADCLVLPGRETWGLVVNEALASGLPCIVSDACGCAEDLIMPLSPHLCFPLGAQDELARALIAVAKCRPEMNDLEQIDRTHSFTNSVHTVVELYLK
jgi:glycosyltransferase involved in cell wall biosynthesis